MKKSSKLKALDGRWKLTANHDLILKANQTKDIAANSLSLKGKIVEAGADFLTFKVRGRSEKGKRIISFLKLKGIWRSDRFNRITFQVKRKIRPETFIFEGAWDINKQQRVVYSYQSVNLKTRKRIEQTIVFDGFWQINQKSRLRYILFNSQVSGFNFRVQVESPNLYPKKGAIKYRLGIGAGKLRREKVITLYGQWKFSRKLGLSFQMPYGQKQIKSLKFGARLNLAKGKKVIFSLLDSQNEPLGLKVTFEHKLFSSKELEYFIQAERKGRSVYFGSGVTLRF